MPGGGIDGYLAVPDLGSPPVEDADMGIIDAGAQHEGVAGDLVIEVHKLRPECIVAGIGRKRLEYIGNIYGPGPQPVIGGRCDVEEVELTLDGSLVEVKADLVTGGIDKPDDELYALRIVDTAVDMDGIGLAVAVAAFADEDGVFIEDAVLPVTDDEVDDGGVDGEAEVECKGDGGAAVPDLDVLLEGDGLWPDHDGVVVDASFGRGDDDIVVAIGAVSPGGEPDGGLLLVGGAAEVLSG